jgi:hypothetical protein
MSLTDLGPLTLIFSPILKTREQIQATLVFELEVSRRDGIIQTLPFTSTDGFTSKIGATLAAEAEAITNRWALQFSSAEAALDAAAYGSLEAQLSAIASPSFLVRRLVVKQIIPLSPRIEKLVPPEKPAEKPAPTLAEEIVRPIIEALPALEALKAIDAEIREQHPDLYNDPYLGGLTTTVKDRAGNFGPQDGMLKRMLDDLKAEVLDYRARK